MKTTELADKRLRVGVSVIKQLSDSFYSHRIMVLEELVSNAYDAFASKVSITLSPEKILVEDDGQGMSSEELVKYFYISHSDQPAFKVKGDLKRYVIGKFGIGKLSMYQLAHAFEIFTWKDGFESHASFDFDAFEKLQYVDEITLNVTTKKTDAVKTGTKIVLKPLRAERIFDPTDVKRKLGRRLAFPPDFEILVNGQHCSSAFYQLHFHEEKINEEVKGVGHVEGVIHYLNKNLRQRDSGIYVRVLGRVINHNPRLIDFDLTTSALLLARRIYGFIDVNSLNEAVLSNRSEFDQENPRYQAFLSWLKTKINKANEIANDKYSNLFSSSEKQEIAEKIGENILNRAEKILESRTASSNNQNRKRRALPDAAPTKNISKILKTLKIEITDLGSNSREAYYDRRASLVSINSAHPLYDEARKRRCLEYHVLKASIVVIALAFSSSIDEFSEFYEELSRTGAIPKIKRHLKLTK